MPAALRPRGALRRARSARVPRCPSARSRRRALTMSPDTAKNFRPTLSLTPWSFHHCAPRCRMTGIAANVSTEFISVGLPHRPVHAGERRLVAWLAAVALHALDQRRLLAEDVAARGGEDVDVEPPAGAEHVVSEHARLARATSSSARIASSSGPYSWRMNIQPCSTPIASIPASMPSITRCGCSARIWRSLNVPGSDSSALQIAYFGSSVLVGDELPLGARREPGSAHPAQARVLDASRSPAPAVSSPARISFARRRSARRRRRRRRTGRLASVRF